MALGDLFNEAWYMAHNPDVAEAVHQGLIDARMHFELYGKVEGRSPAALFDTSYYLQQNPDVAEAVQAGLVTAYDHFMLHGAFEGRTPSPLFDPEFYLAQNPDVADAVAQGSVSAIEHFLRYGSAEPRSISPAIDIRKYLEVNPDVAQAAQAGTISAFDHLLTWGITESRDLGNGIHLADFANDPIFTEALSAGRLDQAIARIESVAPFLPSFERPVGWTPEPTTEIPLDFVPVEGVFLVIPEEIVVPPKTVLPKDVFTPYEPTPGPEPKPDPEPEPSPNPDPEPQPDPNPDPDTAEQNPLPWTVFVPVNNGLLRTDGTKAGTQLAVELDSYSYSYGLSAQRVELFIHEGTPKLLYKDVHGWGSSGGTQWIFMTPYMLDTVKGTVTKGVADNFIVDRTSGTDTYDLNGYIAVLGQNRSYAIQLEDMSFTELRGIGYQEADVLAKTKEGALWLANTSTIYGREPYYFDPHADTGPSLELVKDFLPGAGGGLDKSFLSSNPGAATLPDGQLVFSAYDPVHLNAVWVSDGSLENTRLLADFDTSTYDSSPHDFWSVGDSVLFFTTITDAENSYSSSKALISVGGENTDEYSTIALDNLNVSKVWGAQGDTLYFSGTTWNDDTKEATLALFKATEEGVITEAGPFPENATLLYWGSEYAYFAGADSALGDEPFALDLSTGVATLLLDIIPGSGSSLAHTYSMTPLGDHVLFEAYISESARATFISDGTPDGTHMLTSQQLWDPHLVGDTVGFVSTSGLHTFNLSDPDSGLHTLSTGYSYRLQADSDQFFYSASHVYEGGNLYSYTLGSEPVEIARDVWHGEFKVLDENAIAFTTHVRDDSDSSIGQAELWLSDGSGTPIKIAEVGSYIGNPFDLYSAIALPTNMLDAY